MREAQIAILAPRSQGIVGAGSEGFRSVRCRQKIVKISLLSVAFRSSFVGK